MYRILSNSVHVIPLLYGNPLFVCIYVFYIHMTLQFLHCDFVIIRDSSILMIWGIVMVWHINLGYNMIKYRHYNENFDLKDKLAVEQFV